MSTETLLSLRTQVRQRADMVNSQFVADDELTGYINKSYFELYDLLTTKYGENYFVQSAYQFQTTNTDLYALPSDFYKLLGVDLALDASGQRWLTLKNFQFGERNRLNFPGFQVIGNRTNLKYALNNNNLWLKPIPTTGQTIQIFYVPKWTALVNDTDTVEGISGWLEYVIIDAAIKCMQKEESDCTVLGLQKQAIIARIELVAADRDIGQPSKVVDTYNDGNDFGDGGAGFGGF